MKKTQHKKNCLLCSQDAGQAELCKPCTNSILDQGLNQEVLFDLYARLNADGGNVHTDHTYSPDLVEWLTEHTPHEACILEVGAGNGFFANQLVERGYTNVVASEISADVAEHIAQRFPGLEAKVLDAETLEDQPESYDVIVAVELIEHLLNPEAHVKAVERLLKPGGTYLVRTPNWLASTIYYWIAGRHDMPIWHPSIFSSRGLAQLLKSNGFEVCHLSPRQLPPSQIDKLPKPVRWVSRIPIRPVPPMLRPSVMIAATKPMSQ